MAVVSLFWTPYAPTPWTFTTAGSPLPGPPAGYGSVRPRPALPGNGRSGQFHHRGVDDRCHRHGCGNRPGADQRLGPPAGRRSHHALFDLLFGFPAVLSAILITAVLGPSVVNAMLAIGIFYIPVFARLTRASALTVKGAGLHCRGPGRRARGGGHHLAPRAAQHSLAADHPGHHPVCRGHSGRSRFELSGPWAPNRRTLLGPDAQRSPDLHGTGAVDGHFSRLAIAWAVLGFNLLGDGLRDILDPRLSGDSRRPYLICRV
jgi:hypothetical protein